MLEVGYRLLVHRKELITPNTWQDRPMHSAVFDGDGCVCVQYKSRPAGAVTSLDAFSSTGIAVNRKVALDGDSVRHDMDVVDVSSAWRGGLQ